MTSKLAGEELNFNSIIKKWEIFIDSVRAEKGLILGPMMKNIKPVGLEGNKLMVDCSDDHSKNVILDQKEYLDNKTDKFFGKRLSILFNKGNLHNSQVSVNIPQKSDSQKTQKKSGKDEDDPFVKAIINELGGKELL